VTRLRRIRRARPASRPLLQRRTVLRGAIGGMSAMLALPLLEIMLDDHGEALADGSGLPQRFMTWFFGNGVRLDQFVPSAEGAAYPLSEELAPLANVRDYVSVLTGFDNQVAESNKITHHEGMTIFSGYNNRDVSTGQGFFSNAGGITIDQRIADVTGVGDRTPIKSVQVGVSKRASQVDFGTTMHNLSHRDYLQPLPPRLNPQEVWTQLFDSFVPPEDPQGPLRTSVLDMVKGQLGKLDAKLGAADKKRVQAHLQGVSELQKKIEALPPLCEKPLQPTASNVDVNGDEPLVVVSEAMSELLAYAFVCDITRVASLLFAEGAGNTIYADLGYNSAHHDLTHDNNQSVQDEEVHQGVIYAMERFAYMLELFQATSDGVNGTLLDNIAIFCSSDCSEGWSHSVDDQPMLIAGGAGGQLVTPGIHYASTSGENPTDVLLTMLQLFDPSATEVGGDEPYSNTPFDLIRTTT
jgi:hypothetical protein